MSKNKPLIIVNIIILIAIIIGLLWFMFFGFSYKFNYGAWDAEIVFTNNYKVEGVSTIKTNLKSYDVTFKQNDNSEIKVEVYGNKKDSGNIEVRNSDGVIEVNQVGSSICFGFCFYSNHIVVYVPQGYLGSVDLVTVSGDIELFVDILADNINIKTTSGEVSVQDINNGVINTTSGEVSVKSAKELSIKTVSGDIDINKATRVNLESVSGDVEIKELKSKASIKTTSGDIEIDRFMIDEISHINSISGDVDIVLLNDAYISADSRSGDKDIKSSRGDAELYITTTSGDIRVR